MPRLTDKHQTAPNWQVRGGEWLRPSPFLIAGIVNITPDSFSDGGRFGGSGVSLDTTLARVRQVVAEGADIVDLGAETTKPGARDIGFDEEWRRLAPVLEQTLALRQHSSFAVSIDTYRARTAAAALEARGPDLIVPKDNRVAIINDVSGGSFDPEMAAVLATYRPGYVLGHSPTKPAVMQQDPQYDDVVDELLSWFENRMTVLVKAGLPEERISLDPCIGFGKTLDHTLAIFAAIPRFAALGRPLYFGISRKSFIGALTGLAVHERDTATQVAVALLAREGVLIHRVHAVADTVATLKIASALFDVY